MAPRLSRRSNQIGSTAASPEPFQAARAASRWRAMAVSKPSRVDRAALAAQGVLGQVEREAESVVELERDLAGQRRAGRQLAGLLLEQPQAALERAAEAGLLELQHLGDQRLGAHQLGEGLAHLVEQHRHHPPQQRLAGAQQLGVAHAAAHDPAQHVAAALVGRHDAVGDQEGAAAQMVGDHLVRGAAVAHGVGAGQRRPRRRSAPRTRRCRNCRSCPAARRRCARGPCRCRSRAAAGRGGSPCRPARTA